MREEPMVSSIHRKRRREPREIMTSRPSAADLTVALFISLTASGSGSSSSSLALGDSSSSSSSEMVHPRRYSILQVIFAMFHGVPAIPVLEDGHRAGAEESLSMALRGHIRGVVVGTMDTYLRACGRIPMLCPDGHFDLNAAAMAPPQVPGRGDPPVICARCNCRFCFGVYEVPFLIPPPGLVYPELPVPVAADLVTPPPVVEPLYRRGPGGPVLLVCSNPHHFMVGMALLRQPHDAPALVWRRPSSLAVSGAGSRGRARVAALPEPSTSAGGNGNLVTPGHEDMVQLSKRRRHDPLALTLGRGFESHGGV